MGGATREAEGTANEEHGGAFQRCIRGGESDSRTTICNVYSAGTNNQQQVAFMDNKDGYTKKRATNASVWNGSLTYNYGCRREELATNHPLETSW